MYQFQYIKPDDEEGMQAFFSAASLSASYAVPQLLKKNQVNPRFVKLALLLKAGDQPLGRVALYINPFLRKEKKRIGLIGNYECVDDLKVSQILLYQATSLLTSWGVDEVIGPCNGSTWDDYRFNVSHDKPAFFLESTHPAYYLAQWESFGFRPIAHYISQKDRAVAEAKPESLFALQKMEQSGMTVRNIDLTRIEEELTHIHGFCCQAFQRNYLYTPQTLDRFLAQYLPAQAFMEAEMVLMAFDEQQKMVGLAFCIPDLYAREEKQLILKTLARDPAPRWKGLGNVLAGEIYRRANDKGYQAIIHAFMKTEGASSSLSERYFGEVYKTYILYGWNASQQIVRPIFPFLSQTA